MTAADKHINSVKTIKRAGVFDIYLNSRDIINNET